MNEFICPKCNQPGLPSIYLPMCTACANIERRKGGEIKDYNAAQHHVQRMGLWARISKWFGAIAHR